jgi:hypothetical protein
MKEVKMYAYEAKKGTFAHLDLRCNKECDKQPDQKCLVCGQPLTLGWTIFHGEAECVYCGCPYTVYHYDEKGNLISKIPEVNVPSELLPKYREAWEKAETFSQFQQIARKITDEYRKKRESEG